MADVRRFEIWDGLECDSGSRLAVIRDALNAMETLRVDGKNLLSFAMARDDPAWASVLEQRVIRIEYTDDEFDEWRIVKSKQSRGASQGRLARIEGQSIRQDLIFGLCGRREGDGTFAHDVSVLGRTPSDILDDMVIPGSRSYFAKGTIDPTASMDMTFDWDTPLSALLEIAELSASRLSIRRNGTTNYLVDLLIDATPADAEVEFRVRKNLVGVDYERDGTAQATRVYPKGQSIDDIALVMAEARWEVLSIAALVVELGNPLNNSEGPLAFDDQLNDLYLETEAGDVTKITDSVVSTQKVTVTSVSGISVSDLVKIRIGSVEATGTATTADAEGRDLIDSAAGFGTTDEVFPGDIIHNITDGSWAVLWTVDSTTQISHSALVGGTEDDWDISDSYEIIRVSQLTYLDSPSDQATYGIIPRVLDRQDIAYVQNHVQNPELNGTYVSGVAPNWTKIGSPDVAESNEVLYTRRGGASQYVKTTVGGEGIESAEFDVVPTDAMPFFSGYFSIFIIQGTVRVELIDATDFDTVYPSEEDGRAISNQAETWVDLGVAGIDLNAEGATTVKIRIVADKSQTTEFYVDSAQLTQSAGQQPFYKGDGALDLWRAANDLLVEKGVPMVNVAIRVVDLTRVDPTRWPYDVIDLATVVRLVDEDLGIDVQTKVVDVGRNLLTKGQTRVSLSNRPEDLTDKNVRPRRRKRIAPGGTTRFDDPRFADPGIGWTSGSSDITYDIDFDPETSRIEVFSIEAASLPLGAAPETAPYHAATVLPGQPILVIATTPNWYRSATFVPYDKNGTIGRRESRNDKQAYNPSAGPSGDPSGLSSPAQADTTIDLSWTNGDATAETRVYRNDVVVHTAAAGATTWQDSGLDPSTEYKYYLDHYKNGQGSGFSNTIYPSTTAPTAPTPLWLYACGRKVEGMKIVWGNADTSFKTVIFRSDTQFGTYVEIKVVAAGVNYTFHGSGSGLKWFKVKHRKTGYQDSAFSYEDSGVYYPASDEFCPE